MAMLVEEPRVPVWRSRAFVQPLLMTVGGVVATIAVPFVIGSVMRLLDPCPDCTIGYGIVGAIIEGLLILALGVLITGFVVGWSSPDPRLARRAILLAVVILSLMVVVLVMANDAGHGALDSDQIRDDLISLPVVAIGLLIPIAVGYAIGRLVKGTPKRDG